MNNQSAEEVRGMTANAQPLDPSEIIEYLKYIDDMGKNKPHNIDARLLATIQQLQTELHDVRRDLEITTKLSDVTHEMNAELYIVSEVARELVEKLESVHADERFVNVWAVAQSHCGVYSGPSYAGELQRLKDLLGPKPELPEGLRDLEAAAKKILGPPIKFGDSRQALAAEGGEGA